jgi:hypothetical protein
MSTALKIILDDFADFHDMRRIRRESNGVHTLVFDKRFVVNIESDTLDGAVSIFGSPGSVQPDYAKAAALAEFEWHVISEQDLPFGGRIGVHFGTGVVMLDSQADPAQLDTVSFRQWLLAFVAQMALWESRLGPRVRCERISEQMKQIALPAPRPDPASRQLPG